MGSYGAGLVLRSAGHKWLQPESVNGRRFGRTLVPFGPESGARVRRLGDRSFCWCLVEATGSFFLS
jgi:hypothetical protein